MTKAWDYSSWPAYKSRLWNKKADPGSKDARDTKKAK